MAGRRLADVVVSRRLTVAGRPHRQLTIRFERPRPWRRDWACWFEIRGLGERTLHRAYGIDTLQALTLAIEMARSLVEHRRIRVTGTFAEERGGLPRIVLAPFGRADNEEVHRALDRASARVARRLVRKERRKSKRAAA